MFLYIMLLECLNLCFFFLLFGKSCIRERWNTNNYLQLKFNIYLDQYIFRSAHMTIFLFKLLGFWELPLSTETGSCFQNLNCCGHLIQNLTSLNFLIYPVLLCTAQVIMHLYSFLMLQFERFSSISGYMVRSYISEIYFSNLSA